MTAFEAILLTVVTASTPLLIAALGELVAERSGVLNLGVEGMMVMGAACSFAAAVTFDSSLVGIVLRHPGRRADGGCCSPSSCSGFAANQVGSGLALTILGLGLSGLIGAPFVGSRRDPIPQLSLPVLSDLPLVGRLLFSAGCLRLWLVRADHRGGLVPQPHPRRPRPALGRREPRLRPCPRPAGPEGALPRHPVRRRLRGACGRLSLPRLHPLLVARHDGRAAAGSRLRSSSSPPGGPAGRSSAPISSAPPPCSSCTPRRRQFGLPSQALAATALSRDDPGARSSSRSATAAPSARPAPSALPFVPDR